MADDSKFIGLGRCPVCEQPKARYTLTKSQLVCITCRQPNCGFQGFSRTDDCDEKLRARIGAPAPEAVDPPAPAPAPGPAPVATDPPPPPPPEKSAPGWGVFGAKK